MSTPIYQSKKLGYRVMAIRFVESDPTTHWHVNRGHPRIPELDGKYYVTTDKGIADIASGDWVVSPTAGPASPRVVPAAAFADEFELVPFEFEP